MLVALGSTYETSVGVILAFGLSIPLVALFLISAYRLPRDTASKTGL